MKVKLSEDVTVTVPTEADGEPERAEQQTSQCGQHEGPRAMKVLRIRSIRRLCIYIHMSSAC